MPIDILLRFLAIIGVLIMRRKSKASMMELKENMTLAPVEGVKIDESLTFSMEIPLQILFDQFTTFISKTDFKDIA